MAKRRFFEKTAFGKRVIVSTLMGLGLWIVNFYFILSWLQPLLFGGNWIVRMIPAWVGCLTHLIFAWTVLMIDEWGRFDSEGHLKKSDE